MGEVQSCNPWSINCFVAGYELCCFGASLVNNCEDAVIFLTFWEVYDEIH